MPGSVTDTNMLILSWRVEAGGRRSREDRERMGPGMSLVLEEASSIEWDGSRGYMSAGTLRDRYGA